MTFGPFKIYLQFCPRGRNEKDKEKVWIGISIWYWPPYLTKVLLKCKLIFNEMGLSKNGHKCFDSNHLCLGWCAKVTYKELQNLDEFTLIADVSIVDIFDVEGNKYYIKMEEDIIYKSNVDKIVNNWFRKISINLETEIIDMIINYIISKEIHDFNQLTKYQKIMYQWKVSDNYNIVNIKNATNVFAFASPIFKAFGMKWYIGFWSNGSRTTRKGTVNIFLNLLSFQSINIEIPIRFDINWIECGTTSSNYDTFIITGNGGGETYWPLKTKDINDLDSFTVKLELSLMDVIQNDKIVTHKYIVQNKTDNIPLVTIFDAVSGQFEWEIFPNVSMKLAAHGEEWKSSVFNMFGMKWFLIFYPNGQTKDSEGWTDLCLSISSLPNETSIVSLRYKVYIKELDIRYIASASFYKGVLFKQWGKDRLSTDRFREFNIFTIQLTMELIDVYDNEINTTIHWT